MSIDVIGDFLTIIRNGIMRSKSFVVAPYSRMKYTIAKLLQREGFIRDVAIVDEGTPQATLKVVLKYVEGESVIHKIVRVSSPGKRVYCRVGQLKPVIGNFGIAIVSTSQGVMTNKQAREVSVGGEVLCTVW